MDYAKERWMKVYIRDTASWLAKSWQARGLGILLDRHAETATGEISLGSKGLQAVAALLRAPWEEIGPPLHELLEEGDFEYDEERQVLRDPQHPARQMAETSSTVRSQQARARNPKQRDATPCNAVQRGATPGDDQREERDKTEESETRARTEPIEPEPETESETSLPGLMPPWAEAQVGALAAANLIDVAELDPPLVWAKYEAKRSSERRPLSEPDFRGFVCTWIANWKDRRTRDRAELARREADREAETQRRDRAARGTMSPPVRAAKPDVPPAPVSAADIAAGLRLLGATP